MFGLLILLALAVPVMAVAGFFMALNARERLHRLEDRFGRLEQQLAGLTPGDLALRSSTESAPSTLAAEPAQPPEIEAEPNEPETQEPPPLIPIAPGPARPAISFEERFGTQWVVWAGGIALVLGGFFLVRYSIEQRWFGPGMRVLLGALLALCLIGAGEWTRRTELHTRITGIPNAHIPSILTAAGTAIAYADVYAAYALYGFIGAAAAFLLLGIVALGTLAAALLHGPALAGLGMLGGFVAPLIVSTEQPSYWALYLYLAAVTAAAFALARARLWRWLAIATAIAAALWTLPGIAETGPLALAPHAFHVAAGYTLAALLIVSGFIFGPDAARGQIDFVSSFVLAAYLVAGAFLVVATRHAGLPLTLFFVLVAGTIAIAWRTESATAAIPAAAAVVALVFLQWTANLDIGNYGLPSAADPGSLWDSPYQFEGHLTLGAAFAFLFGAPGFLAQGRSAPPAISRLWAAAGTFVPIVVLILLYWRIADFDRSIPFAAASVGLAGLFALATETIAKRAPQPGSASATAIFATGSVAALALALAMALEKGWLTIALALMVPGIAWVAGKRPLASLRWLAAAITAVVVGRVGWDPRIVGDQLGTTLIFNWLLYGYGIPAASFWLGGYLLRRNRDDTPARIVEAGSLLFTVLLFFFEVRQTMHRGDLYAESGGLAETALDVCIGLTLAIGLEHIRLRSGSVIHNAGAVVIAGLSLLAIVFGLGIADNPTLVSEPVGGRFLNLILLGYGLPAVLAASLALMTRETRPRWYSTTAAVVAVGLALAYLSLEVRRLFHGPDLTEGLNSDAEQYSYSAVWLGFGVALLAAGTLFRSLPVRIASAAVILLTVLKVFLIDMSDLTGIYRALSFLGLGAVLMGIGWFYQRLLFPRVPPAPEPGRLEA